MRVEQQVFQATEAQVDGGAEIGAAVSHPVRIQIDGALLQVKIGFAPAAIAGQAPAM